MSQFIVIEALDAGGSQTQTDLLVSRLRREGHKVLQLHFPQEDRATGQLIYEKFLHANNKGKLSRREQALLYIQDFFSRAEDIRAALKRGYIVVTDRFCTSTMAYQTVGLSSARRRALLNWITWLCWDTDPALPEPDHVLFIDTPVAIALERLERVKKDYHENKRKLTAFWKSYLLLAKEQRWSIVNGADQNGVQRTKQDIHQEIWQYCLENLV